MMFGDPNNHDGKPAFDLYCRQPGTRINAIMEMIDQGWGDPEIALAFDTDAETIAVFRKAHDGKLTTGSDGDPRRGDVYLMTMAGYTADQIAKALKLDRNTVYRWAKEYRPFKATGK